MNNIAHNKPNLGHEEANAASDVIQSGWVSQGVKTIEFENCICNYLGFNKNSAVAVSNGTAALYLSLHVLNLPELSEVIIPSYVCSSLLNAIYMANLTPIIVDVNPIDFNIDLSNIESKITDNTKVIIIPHIYGMPVDVSKLAQLKQKGIFIIEDCATAIGSKIGDQFVGTFGDISIFSFYASKFLTCGNGGMIVSKNSNIIKKIRDYIDFDGVKSYHKRFNFKISDIQSSIGIEQLKKIDAFIYRRGKFADEYKNICKFKGWDFQTSLSPKNKSNNYRFVIKIYENERDNLKQYLTTSQLS